MGGGEGESRVVNDFKSTITFIEYYNQFSFVY